MNKFVEPMLVLNITHIPAEDYVYIYPIYSTFSRDTGDIFHITKLLKILEEEDHSISNVAAIENIVLLAENLQCPWVMFDTDIEEHSDLEVFAW